ncbi:MAG: response regulator, partial [Bacteroidota bacterium]
MRAIAVDDDTQMHQLLRDSLSIIDADVDLLACASTKASGITLIEQHEPDLLFLDIDLPDGTGFDLLEGLSDYGKYLIIFISGHGEHGRRALEFEALDYLDKPLMIDDLETALERAKRRYEQRNYVERMADIQEAIHNFRQEVLPKRLIVSNSKGFYFL